MFKKAFKRIGKDRIKMMVNFEALSLAITCQESISIRLQVTRGDQRPENLELLHVAGKRSQQTAIFPRNVTPFECSYFIKDGVPDAKMAKLSFYATDQSGGGAFQISTLDIDFSRHFGQAFEESTVQLQQTPMAHAKNIVLGAFRYKASITPKKEKDRDAMTQCVTWRQTIHHQEQKQQAAKEERKRAEEQRRQADEEARQRKSMLMSQNEPIRGLGGFNDVFATKNQTQQQRTSSQTATLAPSSSLLKSQDASAAADSGKPAMKQQRTQSAMPGDSQQLINNLAKTQMAPAFEQLNKEEKRKSVNRSAVKMDLRASQELNRSAVKDDLRKSGTNSINLAPTYEKSDEESSQEGADEDPFDRVLRNATQGRMAAATVEASTQKKQADDTESDGMDSDAEASAKHRSMVALQARKQKEEREKDLEIEQLRNEIKTHEQGAELMARKQKLENEIKALQEAIERNTKETDHAISLKDPEKQQLLGEVAHLNAQVEEQSEHVRKLERELVEPRIKLEEVEREIRNAQKADDEAQDEYEKLYNTLAERRQFLELESAEVAKEIAIVAELETQNAELLQSVEEQNAAIESKNAQIDATCKFLDDMETESEKIVENIYECDEQLQIQGNNEIIQATSEANRLRHERNDLEKAKHQMAEEAELMRTQGIELQQKITSGNETLRNMESYTRELEVVIEDSHQEAAKHKQVIAKQQQKAAEEREAKKERDKIKKKIAARKQRERQKSQSQQIQEQEEKQRSMSQARINDQLGKAAFELTEQFNKANDSQVVDDSQLICEDLEETSVKSHDQHDQDEIFGGLGDKEMLQHQDSVNQSRVSIKDGIDISFFSNGGAAVHQQSFRSERTDDEEGTALDFDALMREKTARDTFRASGSQRNSIMATSRSDVTLEHYQTPVKDAARPFEADQSEKQNQTIGKAAADTVTFAYSDKSMTEPDQFSHSQRLPGTDAEHLSHLAKGTPDATWLNYQEQNSAALDDTSPLLYRGEKSLLAQIGQIENVGLPRDSVAGSTVMLEQIAALEGNSKDDSSSSDSNSAYGSFHSDEAPATTTAVEAKKELEVPKKDWMGGQYASRLASIKEDRSDSIMSLKGDEKAEIVRIMAGSAVAANIAHDKGHSAGNGGERFGAVGPQDTGSVSKQAIASIGSVQVAAKEEIGVDQRQEESVEERTRTSSHEIRQKILLATTPRSKTRVVIELKQELELVNQDIEALQNLNDGSKSPERSLSVNSNTAVPIINPSTQDKLQEKLRVKDQISAGLKQLEDRERRQNMLVMSAVVDERDPYAPTDTSSFISVSMRHSIDNRQSRTSSFSSASSRERGGSRGSLYRSTGYDRDQKQSKVGKSRKQVYTELAMRDMQFMLVTGRHVFSALSDYELMAGFNSFESMLRMDKTSHEAMYGLGKVNFLIKRYELAERWFADAFAKKRDLVYRAWLGFTYVQLYKAVTDDNPKGPKYLSYAVKNLTSCVKSDDLAPYVITALLFLSVDLQKAANPVQVKGLEPPAKYLSGLETCLKGQGPLELGLAQAYVDLNTGGRVSQGVAALGRLIQQFPKHPEAYLMLSRHHSLRREFSDEKRILTQAIAKCTEFQSYPERLILTLAHAKNLCKDHSVNGHLEAANLLQLQYTRTPHYASSLLYAYGKAIIDCKIAQLIPSAISALEEAQRCSVSRRVHNCFAYIAKAFNQLHRYPLYVSMHAMNYTLGASQLTYRVGPTKPTKKQKMVDQIPKSSEALMFEIVSAVQSVAAMQANGDAMPTEGSRGSPRYSTLSHADNARSSFQMRSQTMVGGSALLGASASRLNMFQSPLTQLQVGRDQPEFGLLLSLEGDQSAEIEQEVQKLLQITGRLGEVRDKFICQGLIVRGLRNDSAQAHKNVLSELVRLKETIDETSDVQLQTLLVRCLRKADQLAIHLQLNPTQEALHLVEMAKECQNSQGKFGSGNKPVHTTVCLVEAHIEAAKLLFKLSQLQASGAATASSSPYSSSTLLQLALNVLLMALPVLPTIDYKLGNPQLPEQVEDFSIADLESIDFTNCASLSDLAQRIEETKEAPGSTQQQQNCFSQSALMKHKIQSGHFMIQGNIAIDARTRQSQIISDDTKCAVFSFPETLAENVGEIDKLAPWSSTSLSAVATFLESGQASTMAQMLTRLSKMHVHSSPDVLKHIGNFCIKSGKYADLAIFARKEYLISITFSKMFTLAAGQSLTDQSTVDSGYTMIRDKTMLDLAQSLTSVTTGQKRQRTELAKKLIDKVKNGGNAKALGKEINKTTSLLRSLQ